VKKMSVQTQKAYSPAAIPRHDYFGAPRKATHAALPAIVKKTTIAPGSHSNTIRSPDRGLVRPGRKDEATVETMSPKKRSTPLPDDRRAGKEIRQNPAGAASDIVKKVFGALR